MLELFDAGFLMQQTSHASLALHALPRAPLRTTAKTQKYAAMRAPKAFSFRGLCRGKKTGLARNRTGVAGRY
jgi:hypothetical protein